nr:transcription initiation factor tfiid subunit 2 [Quercus suber]
MIVRTLPDQPDDPLNDAHFFRSHRRAERKEKQLRNIERERAMHEKVQLERILQGLLGHDWLKVLGITGVTDAEAKKFEIKRDFYIEEVKGLVDKFKLWKELEKRQRLEKSAKDAEESEHETEGSVEPPSSDLNASASRQLQQETVTAAAKGSVKIKLNFSKQRNFTLGPSTPARTAPQLVQPSNEAQVVDLSPQEPITSFYAKRHLRDAALGKARHGRNVTAFGHPIPDMEERDFTLPSEYTTEDILKANARERRRRNRASFIDGSSTAALSKKDHFAIHSRWRTGVCGTPVASRAAGAMPGLYDDITELPQPASSQPQFTVLRQRVDLDVDFAGQSVTGSTEITIQPLIRDLQTISLHCRQCRPIAVQAGGITAGYEFTDVYRRAAMRGTSDVHQHRRLKEKIGSSLRPQPRPELHITLPPKLKIQEMQVDPITALPAYKNETPTLQKQEADATALVAENPSQANAIPQFQPIKIFIEFETVCLRDGLHWVGFADGDKRFPYCYTKVETWAGNTSCMFPCVDDATSKCSWDISIRCARTLGDAFAKSQDPDRPLPGLETIDDIEMVNGISNAPLVSNEKYTIDLAEDDAAMDLAIVCVGEQIEDIIDNEDATRHTVTFALSETVCSRHIAFAIGPFENVDLSNSRDREDEERLGQSAVKVNAYCLPGRSSEIRVTCMPVTRAIDYFNVNYGSFPFSTYQMLFMDDFIHSAIAVAGISVCSTRLLMDYEVIEPLEENTRILIRTVAEQWAGVNIVAKTPADTWAVTGIAGFMADLYGKVIFGNNAYRWQQKLASEKVYELDADRPSIQQLGGLLHIDSSIRDFLDLKSALVLFILDRRLMKASGNTGVTRIINRIFLHAKTGALENDELSTADFQRVCEKLGHNKLDPFFKQWVFGAGCPILLVKQRFNKKKLVVEMEIKQIQHERKTKPLFAPDNFMREIEEHIGEVWAPEVQPVFTGPMTIRIHEADGTPYEHIVDIREAVTKLDIPYNTKYKRLKRSRRAKERALAADQGEGGDESLLYCLGDILDTEEEMKEWNLAEWSKEDEDKMGQESYEWIRIDADFEWIGRIHIEMPSYMHVSQLQQDRDLVAQHDSMRWLLNQTQSHHMSLSILLRTLMDHRYFHGIRVMAAEGLGLLARTDERMRQAENFIDLHAIGTFHLQKAFEELFCFPGEIMPKPNDWSDRTNYIIQCAIPRAMSKIRDSEGKVPMSVRRFFIDKLKFNDNSNNEYTDCHYIATLINCLSDSLVASHRVPAPKPPPAMDFHFDFGDDDPPAEQAMDLDEEITEENAVDVEFEHEAINEIERVRRIDEWITSYHNVYSMTALSCLGQLTKAGIVKNKTAEVLQYTRSSNSDLVRLQAFQCLTETGLTRKTSTLRYLLHSCVEDPSPFFRERMLSIIGQSLGHIALVEEDAEQAAAAPILIRPVDGLVVEGEDNVIAARQQEAAEQAALDLRRTTPEGALEALKNTLELDAMFKDAIWYAANAPDITLDEVAAFADIAALIYEAKNSVTITLRYPRHYRCERAGGQPGKSAIIRFISHGAYRLRPRRELSLEDWEDIQKHRDANDEPMKYSGPLSMKVRKVIQRMNANFAEDGEKPIKLSLGGSSVQLAQTPTSHQINGTLPHVAALPIPVTEKTGFKLALGGPKRKSEQAGVTSREGSPKAPKIHNAQTPGAKAKSPKLTTKSSPFDVDRSRRTSDSNLRAPGGKALTRLVKLNISLSLSRKIKHIMSLPPKPSIAVAKSATFPASQRTPSLTSSTPLLGPKSPLANFPAGNNFFSPSAPVNSNVGGFRTYGPSPEAIKAEDMDGPVSSTTAQHIPPSPVSIKKEDAVASNGMSVSPVENMPPPMRPKIKLKFGAKRQDE